MPESLASLADFEKCAKAKLPSAQWEWLIGGAESGRTYLRNFHQFHDYYLRPRVLSGVISPRLESSFAGKRISSPIIAAPVGHLTQFHDEGELAVMRACSATETHCVVSMHTRRNLELLAEAAGSAGWSYQVYLYLEPDQVASQIDRALQLGAASVVLTVDSCHRSPSYQRQRLSWDARKFGMRDEPELSESRNDRLWTWEMVAVLIGEIDVPVVIKGVQHAEDAVLAQEASCNAIWISNHGGRANETDQSLLRELSRIRSRVGPALPLVIDGGFRSGSDVAKALLLGSTYVALGRPLVFGLVEGGSRGVESVIDIAKNELISQLGALGISDVQNLEDHTDQVGFSYVGPDQDA